MRSVYFIKGILPPPSRSLYLALTLTLALTLLFSACTRSSSTQLSSPDLSAQQIDTELQTFTAAIEQSGFSGAILISQDGKIIATSAAGYANTDAEIRNTVNTVFDSGSLSKQFTAAAILLLEERGKLSTEQTLSEFFESIPAEKMTITLHHLLTHTSGLPQYVYQGDFIETGRLEAETAALTAELELDPATEYLYSDTGYGLLAAVVERVSGQPFTQFMQENIFEPAGMSSTGYYNDPRWEEKNVSHGYNSDEDFGSLATRPGPYWGLLGFGGVLTTVEDLYKWDQALRTNTVLSADSVEKMWTPHIQEYANGQSYYGYGWVVEEIDTHTSLIWHDGATDSQNAIMLMVGDEQETTIIILSNKIDRGWLGISETFYATDTGFTLMSNVLRGNFSEMPRYAR